MPTHGTFRRIAMECNDWRTSTTMRDKIEKLMELSPKKYKDDTVTYKELQENQEAGSFLRRKYEKILKWINAIFERFDDNKIPQTMDWIMLDAYSIIDYKEIRSMIEDDVEKLARLFTYIDYFFLDGRDQKYRDDYRIIYQLLKKASSDFSWNFSARHEEIERIYNNIWDKESQYRAEQEIRKEFQGYDISDSDIQKLVNKKKQSIRSILDDYFTYEQAIALLSDEFTEITLSRTKDLDLNLDKELQKLKTFFSNTVDLYRGLYIKTIDYNDELTEPEEDLVELIFDFSEEYSGKDTDLFKGQWETVALKDREQIISCIEAIHKRGEDIINKYIGAVTAKDLQMRMDRIKYKLRNPLIYRILIQLEDIKTEVRELQWMKDNVSKDTDCDGSEMLRTIEKRLNRVYTSIVEKNRMISNSLDDVTIIFGSCPDKL
jgi:hypothetical protein